MYCSKCGAQNPDDAKVCQACSAELAQPVVAQAATQQVEQVVNPKTSGWAIAALVMGILAPFLCFPLLLPAVICGIVALVKISGSQGRLKGNGLAIAGIAVPVLALPVMMAILLPALSQVRSKAMQMICATNLSGIGKVMVMYVNDNGEYPDPHQWCDELIEKYDVTEKMLICPASIDQTVPSYAMNANVVQFGSDAPADMVLIFESVPGRNLSGGPELLNLENHDGEGCNICFVDGSVEFIKAEDVGNLRW